MFPLYKNFGSEQVYAASGLTDVNIFAAKRADGILTLIVINISDVEQHVPFQIKGLKLKETDVWLLDAMQKAENLGTQSFVTDGVLTLSAQSATVFVTK